MRHSGGAISALEVWAISKIRWCRISTKQPTYQSSVLEAGVSVSELVCCVEAVMVLVAKPVGMMVYTAIESDPPDLIIFQRGMTVSQ